MTSIERVFTALGHAEPDRVPVFLLVTMHGAKELGLTLREYYSRAEHVVEGQLRMRRRYGHDCLLPFFYGAVEYEAFGGQAVFSDDGPVNAGEPVIRSRADIFALEVPDIRRDPRLQMGLEATRRLVEAARGEVPVVGTVIAPYSLPVMLMGFERYLDLMHDDREAFARLMQVTQRFCVEWANAQLEAGATAVGCADPLAAVNLTETSLYLQTGFPVLVDTLRQINGAAALSLASGRALGRIDTYVKTGAAALGVSNQEDLAELKRQCAGRLPILGNLNGVAMAHWTPQDAEQAVKDCIQAAGRGGGFVLADTHGEIPFQVDEEVLMAIMEAARRWGRYPLENAGIV
ncbi:MAG: uroporphyrinogen decarboxylase family protein [Pseudomonadota bacterium]